MIDVKIDFSKATAAEIEAFYATPEMANMLAALAIRGRELNIAFSVGGENEVIKNLMAGIAAKLPPHIEYDEYHKIVSPACDAFRQ
jgi:hypothetical protein